MRNDTDVQCTAAVEWPVRRRRLRSLQCLRWMKQDRNLRVPQNCWYDSDSKAEEAETNQC